MTEEQIKQNAEDYINENTQGVVVDTDTRQFLLDIYLAGAKFIENLNSSLVNIKDGLPENNSKILVRYIDGDYEVVRYRKKRFKCLKADQRKCIGTMKVVCEGVIVEKPCYSAPYREDVTDIVTHWMELPK